MKKQIKGLALLALGFVFAGALSLNTVDVKAAEGETYFKMIGASIRVPQANNTDVKTNDNGIRFTAQISKTMYDSAAKTGEVSVGMFILPAAYTDEKESNTHYVAEVNEGTCFGDTIAYKWLDDDNQMVNAEVEGAKQIIHVSSKAYEKKEGDDFYTINGSLLHLQDTSLMIDFIGYAYMKVETTEGVTYTFADQTDEGADNVVNVAQTALLTGVPDEDDFKSVNDGYINRYITVYQNKYGEDPTIKVNVDVRKQTSSTSGWVSDSTYTAEVPFTAYNVTTASIVGADVEGYSYVDAMTEVQVAKFDGTTKVVHNYDYVRESVVLWDGDTKTAETTTGQTNYSTFNANTAANLVYGFDNYERTEWTIDGEEKFSPAVSAKSIYQGKSGAISGYAASWDGPLYKEAIKLPFITNQVSLIIDTNGYNMTDFAMELFVAKYDNAKAGSRYIGATSYTIETIKSYEGADVSLDTDSSTKTLSAGVHKLLVTFPEPFEAVYGIDFKLRAIGGDSTGSTWYFDNVCAEASYYDVEVPLTYADSITVDAANLKSTTLFGENELATEFKVEYKAEGEDVWEIASGNESGAYTFATADGVNTYTVKVTAGKYSKEYTVRRGVVFADFDKFSTDNSKTSFYINATYGLSLATSTTNTSYYTITNISGYKDKFLKSNLSTGDLYIHALSGGEADSSYVKTDFTITKVGLWIYVTADTEALANKTWTPALTKINGQAASYGTWGNLATLKASDGSTYQGFKAGYGYYEVTFSSLKDAFMAFDFCRLANIYVSEIALLA